MKTRFAFAAAALIATGFAGSVPAQLAITEVMAESSTNGLPAFRGPDYWELTNFGTNDIDLHGYGFSDDKPTVIVTEVFDNLTIRAHESILFCRSNPPIVYVNSPDEFKAWWGGNQLPADLQVRFYVRPGLSEAVDQLWLRDPAGNVVDMVTFGASLPGRSMTYDLETGTFGFPSVPGVNGAFRAANATNDVGSPGWTAGRVRLHILRQPASQTVDGCGDVRFSVLAGGVPRPTYQWTSNGIPVPGATGPTLTLPDIGTSAAGEYRVLLKNGFEELLSDAANLLVNTNPLPPTITLPPFDTTVFPGQTGRFSVEIRGFPCPDYRWYSNNVALPGETGRTLVVAVPDGALRGTTLYTFTASNGVGTASASARLVVTRVPCLQITEVMSWPTNDNVLDHKGWFELTNCDTDEVDLQGYRFRDTDLPEVAFIITNSVIVRPGESVVFVESMSREAFVQWWGADRLPPDLQVLEWRGWGLSKSTSDTIHFWNSSPSFPANTVATLSLLDAIEGFSQETSNFCDDVFGCGGFYLRESVPWESGAFAAEVGGDVGSPGYTANPPPRLLGVSLTATGIQVRCRGVAGKSYTLSFKGALMDAVWTPLETRTAGGSVLTFQDAPQGGTPPARFYRVEELP